MTFACNSLRSAAGSRFMRAWGNVARLVIAVMMLIIALPASAQDEEDQVIPWEYRPYKVQLFVGFDGSPWYAPARRAELLRSFEQQSFREGGSAWEVAAVEAPPDLAGYLVQGVEGLSLERVMAFDAALVDRFDKLIFLQLSEQNLEFIAEARELDGRTRFWGPIIRRSAIQPELIAAQAYDAVLNAFAPIVRVGRKLDDGTVDCSLRAGFLITNPNSPALLREHEVLLPITRHNGRDGQPRPDGIVPSPWTFLGVKSVEGGNVICDLHSGVRNSVGASSSRRKERLALSIKLDGKPTRLVLQTSGQQPEPLVGYEIHSKNPFTDGSFEFLGRSNWAGEIMIPPGDSPLRVLYVKNGDRVLNRLPMMPGLEPQLVAELNDDSRRLEAEGFVSGVEGQIMDLVAMRAIFAASINRELDQGNLDKADEQLKKFRALPSQSDLSVQLEQEQRRIVASTPDVRLRGRIDVVFDNVKTLITTLIDPAEEARLAAEIAKARAGTRKPTEAPAAPAEETAATPEPAVEEADPTAAFGSGSGGASSTPATSPGAESANPPDEALPGENSADGAAPSSPAPESPPAAAPAPENGA